MIEIKFFVAPKEEDLPVKDSSMLKS